MEFLSHNIQLADGTWTLPEAEPMGSQKWVREALAVMNDEFTGDRSGIRVADLGCLEGGYAVEFARAGYDVTGIEVRQSNIDCCLYAAERLDLSNLKFVHDDAWHVADHGPFDVIFCGGLLYHMATPKTFLECLALNTSQLLIVNTHFAVESGPQQHRLGPVTEHEGYRGRWYTEFPDAATHANREQYRLSSWDNRRSFWLLRSEITRCLRYVGFAEAADLGEDLTTTGFNRGLFVARK